MDSRANSRKLFLFGLERGRCCLWAIYYGNPINKIRLSIHSVLSALTTGAVQGGDFQVPTEAHSNTYYLQSIHADVLQLADFLEHLESRMVATPDAADAWISRNANRFRC